MNSQYKQSHTPSFRVHKYSKPFLEKKSIIFDGAQIPSNTTNMNINKLVSPKRATQFYFKKSSINFKKDFSEQPLPVDRDEKHRKQTSIQLQEEKLNKQINIKTNDLRKNTIGFKQLYLNPQLRKTTLNLKLPAIQSCSTSNDFNDQLIENFQGLTQNKSTKTTKASKASKSIIFPSDKIYYKTDLVASQNLIRTSISSIFESSQNMKLKMNELQKKSVIIKQDAIIKEQANEEDQPKELEEHNQLQEQKQLEEKKFMPKRGWKELIDKLQSKKIISGKFRRKCGNQSFRSLQSYESNQTDDEEFEIWDNSKDVRLTSMLIDTEEKGKIQNFLQLYKARYGGFPGFGEHISNEQVIQVAVKYAASNKKLFKKYFPQKYIEFDDNQDYSKPYDRENDANFKQFHQFCEQYMKNNSGPNDFKGDLRLLKLRSLNH